MVAVPLGLYNLRQPMLTPNQIAGYQRGGFVSPPEAVLSDAEVERLRAALDEVIRGAAPGEPVLLRNLAGGDLNSDAVVIQIVDIWKAHPAIEENVRPPELVQMVAQL